MPENILNISRNILIDSAIEFAAKVHGNGVRKGTDIPYITHPFSVGILLTEIGCSEEVIAAGILHDTVEETPTTLDDLLTTFGKQVADIVAGCTEPDKSLPWEERKQHTIDFLKIAPLEVRLVSCADKLHNIRSIAIEYSRIGDRIWKRFKRGKKDQEWYYRGIVESLCDKTEEDKIAVLSKQLKKEVDSFFVPSKKYGEFK